MKDSSVRTTAYGIAMVLVVFTLTHLYSIYRAGGDDLMALIDTMSIIIIGVIVLLPLLLVKGWLQTKPTRTAIGIGTVAGVASLALIVLVILAFNTHLAPAGIQAILRSHGKVATAKVLHYDLYDSSTRHGTKITSFYEARRINVLVELPDGHHEKLDITNSYPGYSRSDITRQILELELAQGTLKVRYLPSAQWFIRPEIEFNRLTQPEACELLGPRSRVCAL